LLPPSHQPRELASGVDALYLSGRGDIPDSILADVDALKTRALEVGSKVDWTLGGYPVRVKPGRFGSYRYAIEHELALFGLTPSDSLPAVRVQPTSLALHSLGPELTVMWVRNVLDAAGIDAVLSVARLDLHSDWQGLWIDAEERRNFVTYSDKRALYEVADDLSGLNFGQRGGAIYARLYDKSREQERKGDDWWPDVWGEAFDPAQRVLRVEFEFNRDGLRECGVNTPEEAFDQVGPLWAYAASKWLTLRVPTDDDTRSRWPIDDRWVAVQRATLAGNSIPAERVRSGQTAGSMRKLLPALVGYLTNAAVLLGTTDLATTCRAVQPFVDAYEQQTGLSFAQRCADKASRS